MTAQPDPAPAPDPAHTRPRLHRDGHVGMGLPHVHSGKVRDIYAVGDDQLLMVTSDRISAFDVVMAEPIPDKGRVLTAMSAFWFELFADVVPGHLLATDTVDLPAPVRDAVVDAGVIGRAMLTRRADMLPVECIVRGYLSGSAWREYRRAGTMHGVPLASGLRESDRLPAPVFTPSTKAEEGHDENISFDESVAVLDRWIRQSDARRSAVTGGAAALAARVREVALELYRRGAEVARDRGIIIADTKFELGLAEGELMLCDEVLTPDSSRFWPADAWEPGRTPPSFDKQPVRDYLDTLDWDKQPPPPSLPPDVVKATSERYVEAYERITARSLASWPGA